MRRKIVLICGASGSGKTTLAGCFTDKLIVSTDDFYKGKSQMIPDQKGRYNFDAPEAICLSECRKKVLELASLEPGETIEFPEYNMKISERFAEPRIVVAPSWQTFIILEGIFSFHIFSNPRDEDGRKTISSDIDPVSFRVWVEPNDVDKNPSVIIARRIIRDVAQRGRSVESVLQQIPDVLKGFKDYISEMRTQADLITGFGVVI